MLYLLYRGNRQGLTYTGGQTPIVHLVADMEETIAWADQAGIQWAFSNRNAGAAYADFFADLDDIDKVNWDAVEATDFRDFEIKDGKQAEFLLFERFPWELIETIGVINDTIGGRVQAAMGGNVSRPRVEVRREWYY